MKVRNMLKRVGSKIWEKRHLVITGILGIMLCVSVLPIGALAATNPVENGRKLVMSWLEPLVYIGLSVFGVILLAKRKFTEFFGFAGIAVIAVALVFYPESIKTFLGTIVTTLFG
ncbi:hypothetical protein [Faecalimonas sp.]